MKFRLEGLKNIQRIVKQLAVGLRDLTFTDNFTSFVVSGTIASSGTITVRNELNSENIRYTVHDNNGDGSINRTEPWDSNYISFKNNGSVEAEFEIIVYKK
jgi:hypothetical protein